MEKSLSGKKNKFLSFQIRFFYIKNTFFSLESNFLNDGVHFTRFNNFQTLFYTYYHVRLGRDKTIDENKF